MHFSCEQIGLPEAMCAIELVLNLEESLESQYTDGVSVWREK